MSDVSTNVADTAPVMQTVLDTLNSGWGYSIGGIILVIAAGYFVVKKLNTPRFVIAQIRRRNMKEMKKLGTTENTEAMVDLDKLLDSVEAYATKQGMSGNDMAKLLTPLQQVSQKKSATSFYHSMAHIAKNIGDTGLANTLTQKSKQVKASSPLMAGLLKRAGV
ncbi:hypothetical protein [Vibrio nitrifigilis]|uniref:DUF4381 domain-containing protein n=1 Tax=Vibrio nitrifigilis TaxID=2789781 RepID=A0ABS0GBI5_9VIBR|nr:hypothetical protein [Vibrio nitrifigilis]MBF8999725.1 hypothetical protein [Vibrio nitrifigilis]